MKISHLVISSAVVLAIIAISVLVFSHFSLPSAKAVQTASQPTIGNLQSNVQVVVFEEPKCSNCAQYNKSIFPLLKREFIDTGKIAYTTIIVSFLPNSGPAASALWNVYMQDSDYPNAQLFYTYLDYICRHQPPEDHDWVTINTLLDFARAASPAINLDKLKNSLEAGVGRVQILKNTEYAAQLMGGEVRTPTVFVNGVEVKRLTFENVRSHIYAAMRGS